MPSWRSTVSPRAGTALSLAESHSDSRLRNLAREFPPLPLPWNRRAGQASLSSDCLSSTSISLGRTPGPLTHEWGTQEPPGAEAAEPCGMEVCLLSLRVQMPSSALLQGTHTCRPAGSLQGPLLQPGAPQFPVRGDSDVTQVPVGLSHLLLLCFP